MCEWLSCREWCDVQLLCGGRTFTAHRVVLASVSTFLRQLLLSCPIEDAPTFIVLPDFDLEAMSSVLYYIYNGEVIVQKQKLDMFLDIVKAMQIFIDCQYLPRVCNSTKTTEFASNYRASVLFGSNKMFTIGGETCKDPHYITIKKGEDIQNVLLQYSFNGLDFRDKQISSKDLSEQQNPALANLQSSCEDRQRNSFLRDLFIETYPQNGNANGRTAGVLAISNERYRGPTSVLLTNANGKHLRVDDTLTEKTEHISQPTASFHSWELHTNAANDGVGSVKHEDISYTQNNLSRSGLKSSWMNYFLSEASLKKTLHSKKHISSYLDLSITESVAAPKKGHKFLNSNNYLMGVRDQLVNSPNKDFNKDHYSELKRHGMTNSSLARHAILNQVLESPWCPRLPNNYKPFRRKVQDATNSSMNKVSELDTVNDSNNNIRMSTVPESVVLAMEKNPTTATTDPLNTNTSYSISNLVGETELKNDICEQVFTSTECLRTHTRHHSSTARYSCSECSKSFSQLRNFKYHMSVHRGTREFAATCTVCGKYFNDRGYLSSHMKIHKNRKEYKCSQCPKSFNQRVAYNMHVRIHTGVKPHVCTECGKAFSRKMLLKQHQRTHSGERPYPCPHCDKRFADRSNMTLHLRLHTGVKPFSCSLCPKSFTKKHHLKSHLNFHTGAKPYACPRCKLAFTQSSNMRTHLKKCSAPDPMDTQATNHNNAPPV